TTFRVHAAIAPEQPPIAAPSAPKIPPPPPPDFAPADVPPLDSETPVVPILPRVSSPRIGRPAPRVPSPAPGAAAKGSLAVTQALVGSPPPAPHSPSSAAPLEIPGYRIVRKLGEGGMGIVY